MVTVGITAPRQQHQIRTETPQDFCCRRDSSSPFCRFCGRHIGVTQTKEGTRMTANPKEVQRLCRFPFSLHR
jgi:hypothetical protein